MVTYKKNLKPIRDHSVLQKTRIADRQNSIKIEFLGLKDKNVDFLLHLVYLFTKT